VLSSLLTSSTLPTWAKRSFYDNKTTRWFLLQGTELLQQILEAAMFIDAMFSDPDVRDEPMEIGFDQAPVMFKMDRDYEHDFSFVATKGPPSIVVRIGTGLKPDAEFASWVSGFCAVKTFDHRWNHQALLELRALSKVATETYDLEELIANTIDRLEAPMSECNDHHLESSNGQAEGPESSPILAEGDLRIPSELVAINCALEPGEECGPDLVVHRISTRNKRASSDTHHLVSCQVETGDKSTRQGSRGHGSGLWHLGQLTTAKRDLQDHRGPILLFDHALSPAKEAPALKDARTGTISMNHMTVRQYLSAKEEHEMWPDAKALNQQPSFFWYRRQSGTAHASVEDHGILHDSGRSRLLLSPVRILAKSGLMLLCLASMHIMRNYAVSRELSSPAANTWFLSMAIRGDQVCAFA
jgi:hypothetical protein